MELQCFVLVCTDNGPWRREYPERRGVFLNKCRLRWVLFILSTFAQIIQPPPLFCKRIIFFPLKMSNKHFQWKMSNYTQYVWWSWLKFTMGAICRFLQGLWSQSVIGQPSQKTTENNRRPESLMDTTRWWWWFPTQNLPAGLWKWP